MNPAKKAASRRGTPPLGLVAADPGPPAGLGKDATAWWRSVIRDYDYSPSDLRLVNLAAEALSQAGKARAILDRDGLTVAAADGSPRRHPCVGIERESRQAFVSLLKLLLPREQQKRHPRNQWRPAPKEG